MSEKKLTHERLKEVLHYNPNTGFLYWRVSTSNFIMVNQIAGGPDSKGYIKIKIDGYTYKAHRLAWFYIHGYLPENDIDHIDRVKHHNWILNLRESSKQCNQRNIGNQKNTTSGVKGVYLDKKSKKWIAQIKVNYKTKYLGIYKSFRNAACARLAGEQCLNWAGCNSNSPAYQYVRDNIIKKGGVAIEKTKPTLIRH